MVITSIGDSLRSRVNDGIKHATVLMIVLASSWRCVQRLDRTSDRCHCRTVCVVTTAAGQSFDTIYEGTPLFLSIPGVDAITVLSAVLASSSHCSVAVSPEEYRPLSLVLVLVCY